MILSDMGLLLSLAKFKNNSSQGIFASLYKQDKYDFSLSSEKLFYKFFLALNLFDIHLIFIWESLG